MQTRRAVPRNALVAAAILVCVSAAVAVASYRAGRHAATPPAELSALVWLGPQGSELDKAVDARLQKALVTLNGPGGETTARVPGYRSELMVTSVLLRRTVLANLADTRAIERLAAVEWELGVLDGIPDEQSVGTLVGIAGARAPRASQIQVELGEAKMSYPSATFENGTSGTVNRPITLSPVPGRGVKWPRSTWPEIGRAHV